MTRPPTPPHARPADGDGYDAHATLEVEQRFAIVPEWVIDADLSDAAFRLYSLLLRYGNGTGTRMPSRRLLATRLHRSVDSIDRAMRELERRHIVAVERRRRGKENLTNRYHLRTTNPALGQPPRAAPRPQSQRPDSGRTAAPTPSRRSAATPSRTDAATLAADVRPYRENPTDRTPPPPPSPAASRVSKSTTGQATVAESAFDLPALAELCAHARHALGLPITRWAPAHLDAAIQLALLRGWPPALVEPALLTVAADPQTRSPMRLAEAGPWWDQPASPDPEQNDCVDLAALEAELDDVAHLRPALQARARAELRAEHLPVNRTTVTVRAVQILHRSTGEAA